MAHQHCLNRPAESVLLSRVITDTDRQGTYASAPAVRIDDLRMAAWLLDPGGKTTRLLHDVLNDWRKVPNIQQLPD